MYTYCVYYILFYVILPLHVIGLGCEFVTESCTNESSYPYTCVISDERQCTFDLTAKVNRHIAKKYIFNINLILG